jgi:ABC-type phosphate/phosphonate transport system substrate-binding protein
MGAPFAQLAMYPMSHLDSAYDLLWQRLIDGLAAEGVEGAPSSLAWDRDLHEAWHDPNAFVTNTCGWPLITVLREKVAVVGSFDVVAPFASGGHYRSVIVSSKPLSVAEWKQRGDCRLVANNPDSLSGWVSLSWAWGERLDALRFVGAHVESIREIVEGRADLASIDAVTFEHVITSQPSVAARVHVVGHGPEVPSLPLVCANRFADNVPAFRRVLASLTAPESLSQDRELADALGTLKIKGFVPFGIEAFEFLPGLLPPPVG